MTKVERIEKYKQARKHPKGPQKRLFSVPEAAYYLGRTTNALRSMIYSGKLPYVRDGRRIFLDKTDLDARIDQCKTRFTY